MDSVQYGLCTSTWRTLDPNTNGFPVSKLHFILQWWCKIWGVTQEIRSGASVTNLGILANWKYKVAHYIWHWHSFRRKLHRPWPAGVNTLKLSLNQWSHHICIMQSKQEMKVFSPNVAHHAVHPHVGEEPPTRWENPTWLRDLFGQWTAFLF